MIDVRLTSSQRRPISARLRATEDASYGRRLLAILALDEGESVSEVAEKLGVTRQTVYNWVRTDNASFTFYRQRIVQFLSPRTDSAPLGPEAGRALASANQGASGPSPEE